MTGKTKRAKLREKIKRLETEFFRQRKRLVDEFYGEFAKDARKALGKLGVSSTVYPETHKIAVRFDGYSKEDVKNSAKPVGDFVAEYEELFAATLIALEAVCVKYGLSSKVIEKSIAGTNIMIDFDPAVMKNEPLKDALDGLKI